MRCCAKPAIVLGVAALLASFFGCAPAEKKWPFTERLADGREGFVLREKPVTDPKTRAEFDRAVALLDQGKNDAAIELLKKVIDKTPELTAPRVNIAIAYLRTGDAARAEQHLKDALELVPGHPVASNEEGLILRRAGKFKEAREVYERSIDAFPDYLPVRKNLGILCDLYLNDPACALKQFELYSERVPGDEKVKTWVAELRMRLGKQ